MRAKIFLKIYPSVDKHHLYGRSTVGTVTSGVFRQSAPRGFILSRRVFFTCTKWHTSYDFMVGDKQICLFLKNSFRYAFANDMGCSPSSFCIRWPCVSLEVFNFEELTQKREQRGWPFVNTNVIPPAYWTSPRGVQTASFVTPLRRLKGKKKREHRHF